MGHFTCKRIKKVKITPPAADVIYSVCTQKLSWLKTNKKHTHHLLLIITITLFLLLYCYLPNKINQN